ncbi:hypothetical protein SH668x_001277 [Planctomicrobium sp. SH668]|uniref:hypothetical protein n=1 Tax=Planctomicrobium sp. SH668 TaxID=3448126 RepID=UPI003F5BB745
MIFKYGSYTHERKEVTVKVSSEVVRTPRDVAYGMNVRIDVSGSIFGDSQSALIQNIQALIAAYAFDGQDVSLTFNDGTPTPDLTIRNIDTIGGVRVLSIPTLDVRNLAEYSTYWDYSISLEATIKSGAVQMGNWLWEFDESIEVIGLGGPTFTHVPLKWFRWQKQRNRSNSLCRATQSGTITGLGGYLPNLLPGPRWPDDLVNDSVRIRYSQPTRLGNTYMLFRIDYGYQFESNSPLVPQPPTIP